MLSLSKCPALLVLGVTLTACGAAPLNVATRAPATSAPRLVALVRPDPTHAPKLHPILPPRIARVAPRRWLQPTPTSAPPAAHVVQPPRVEQGPTGFQNIGDYHAWLDWPLWEALGHCEEPGGGPDGIAWDTNTGVYVGGFAMARTTFDGDAHAIGMPLWHAGYAPADQIKVARYGHFVQHQYWGCGRLVPGWY